MNTQTLRSSHGAAAGAVQLQRCGRTMGGQTRTDRNLAARDGARFHQLSVCPTTAVRHVAVLVPHHAQAAAPVARPLALVHAAVRPRVRPQTALLSGDEIALVAIAVGKDDLAAPVQLSVAPLTAGRLGAVRTKLDALSVRFELRVEFADEVAAVGQQQRAAGVGSTDCSRRRRDGKETKAERVS